MGPEDGCPKQFVGCLDVDGGLALERNLRRLRRYTQEAAVLCYTPDGGSSDHPQQ